MRRWSFSKFRSKLSLSRSDSPFLAPSFQEKDSLPPEAMRPFAETVLWCSRQDLRTSCEDPEYLRNKGLLGLRKFKEVNFASLCPLSAELRSRVLQPALDIGEYPSKDQLEHTVAQVIVVRSQLVAADGPLDQDSILSERRDRLLHYWPAENVSDGASEVGSLGFFNGNDIPPWDTWIHYAERKLTCWVPEELIGLAQDGIDGNPVDCIHWADQ